MLRKSIVLSAVLMLTTAVMAQRSVISDESGRATKSTRGHAVSLNPSRVLSPGFPVGETDYDWQYNSGGRRYICQSPSGGHHFYWTYAKDGDLDSRRPYYRYRSPQNTWTDAKAIDDRCGRMGGLTQLSNGRAVATAHVSVDIGINISYVYIDTTEGAGSFRIIPLPFLGDPDSATDSTDQPHWPSVVVDSNNTIYVFACQFTALIGWWTCSKDLGQTWSPWSDTLAGSYLDAESWGSGGREVVAVRNNTLAVINVTDNFDLIYYETSDQGGTWRKDTICIMQETDSVLPYMWYSGVYDNNNVLHVAYAAIDTTPGGGGGGQYGSGWRSQIKYWNSTARQSSVVTSGWWPNNPGPGANRPTVAEANIAIDRSNGSLYCTWTQANEGDLSDWDYNNLEIYGAKSTDNGQTWLYHQNITNSPSPGAAAGECESDCWHSIAQTVTNDTMHIFYMNDRHAASSVMDATEPTVNPMLYLNYKLAPTGIFSKKQVPQNMIRISASPNPFRNRIEIRLNCVNSALAKNRKAAKLSIVNTNGRVIREVSFRERFVWNGTDERGSRMPAGIYLVHVEYDGMKHSSRLVLLK